MGTKKLIKSGKMPAFTLNACTFLFFQFTTVAGATIVALRALNDFTVKKLNLGKATRGRLLFGELELWRKSCFEITYNMNQNNSEKSRFG